MPVVLLRPAQKPAKKLLIPVPPVPEMQLTMLVVLQTLNAELPAPVAPVNPVAPETPVAPVGPPDGPVAPVTPVAPIPPPVNSAPLMHRPVLSTRMRSQVPAAMTTVLHRPAVPTMDPMIVF